MNIVIIGSGKIGRDLACMLADEGHNITVVDNAADAFQKIQTTHDILCIEGNGAVAEVQRLAGMSKADLMIATTPHDELNMLCCLIARNLGCGRTISRVRTPEYYNQIDVIKDDLGLSMVINPERITADEIRRLLMFPSATKVEVFQKGKLELVEQIIPETSTLCNLSLIDIYKVKQIKMLICAVVRNNEVFIPDGNFIIRAGDKIYVAASRREHERFFKSNGIAMGKLKNIMIVGGGKICFYLASQLTAIGMKVKIIEKDLSVCQTLAELVPKARIIHGDGNDKDLLVEEGINDTDPFIALTGSDEQNILMSLYAKSSIPAKIIAKVNDEGNADLSAQLGLDCIINPKDIITNEVLSYIRSLKNTKESNIESLYRLVGNQLEAIEFRINENIPEIVDKPLRELKLKKNMLIGAIIRKRDAIIPNGNDTIQLGDSIVVVSKDYHVSDIRDILHK